MHSSARLGQLQGDGIRKISGLVSGTSNRGVFGNSYEGAFGVSGRADGPSRDGDWAQGHTLSFYAARVALVVGEVPPGEPCSSLSHSSAITYHVLSSP